MFSFQTVLLKIKIGYHPSISFFFYRKLTFGRMIKSKWKLILGLILLICGIILKLISNFDHWAVFLIALGAFLKVLHIIGIIKNRSYKPGWEIVILILGLSLFFFGLYICQIESRAQLFIICGLLLKTTFVVMFIRKLNK